MVNYKCICPLWDDAERGDLSSEKFPTVWGFYRATLCVERPTLSQRVRPSVTILYRVKTVKDIVKTSLPPDSHIILDFPELEILSGQS